MGVIIHHHILEKISNVAMVTTYWKLLKGKPHNSCLFHATVESLVEIYYSCKVNLRSDHKKKPQVNKK